jgi:hypothetical protein
MSTASMAASAPVAWQGWTALAEHPVAYPALEVVHLIGLGLLLGPLALLDLRLWGLARGLEVLALARLALPLVATGFTLAAGSGLLMFSTQPQELLGNRFFLGKMVLIGLAGVNAAIFHLRGCLQGHGAVPRLQTLLSLMLWVGVIICGRWIAYA